MKYLELPFQPRYLPFVFVALSLQVEIVYSARTLVQIALKFGLLVSVATLAVLQVQSTRN
jgi:hypothetical protein